jgi:WD40 repeat protein
VIDVITVPEHNPTGEPGGPFNSFDDSWIAPAPSGMGDNLDYVSDRIGLSVDVFDTTTNLAVNALQGSNAVTDAGNGASACDPTVPPLVSVFGNYTRFGCRTQNFHLNSGFGANGNFGGFPGAQCCASRGNGVNPMSGPDGETTTPDGKFLFSGNGSASVVVWDLTTMNLTTNPPTPPTVVADIPTGVSGDYDGPQGIAACIASWNGEAGSSADCGDDRADEMALGPVTAADGTTHQVLAVINGDPGFPFITFIDMTSIVSKTGTPAQQHCWGLDAVGGVPTDLPFGPYPAGFTPAQYPGSYPNQGTATVPVAPAATASFNPPSCIIGQIYYDGAGGIASAGAGLNAGVPVDVVPNAANPTGTFACPDPSNPQTFGGVSGSLADAALVPGIGNLPSGGTYTIPCHHGPIVDQSLGTFCSQTAPGSTCSGAISPAGVGGMAWNPNTGHLLLTNSNSIAITNIGSVDEIDPRVGNNTCGGPCGPVVVNSFVMPNCMPGSIVQGPGNNFLIGCADHDGEAFPPNEYVIDGTSGAILATIWNVGGVDEIWYNSGDNRYYVAARDMPNGPVMGVIDAGSNLWLANVTTNTNSHSLAVDPSNNHAFVPMQAGGICTTQSGNGCVGVIGQQ